MGRGKQQQQQQPGRGACEANRVESSQVESSRVESACGWSRRRGRRSFDQTHCSAAASVSPGWPSVRPRVVVWSEVGTKCRYLSPVPEVLPYRYLSRHPVPARAARVPALQHSTYVQYSGTWGLGYSATRSARSHLPRGRRRMRAARDVPVRGALASPLA